MVTTIWLGLEPRLDCIQTLLDVPLVAGRGSIYILECRLSTYYVKGAGDTVNLILDTPTKARLYRSVKELGVCLGERLITATQIRRKKRSVVKWYPTRSLNEASTIIHAGSQFKGQALVREIQRATSHDMPVPVKGDWDWIVTQVPPVLYPTPYGQ